jgi:hypothetical protein
VATSYLLVEDRRQPANHTRSCPPTPKAYTSEAETKCCTNVSAQRSLANLRRADRHRSSARGLRALARAAALIAGGRERVRAAHSFSHARTGPWSGTRFVVCCHSDGNRMTPPVSPRMSVSTDNGRPAGSDEPRASPSARGRRLLRPRPRRKRACSEPRPGLSKFVPSSSEWDDLGDARIPREAQAGGLEQERAWTSCTPATPTAGRGLPEPDCAAPTQGTGLPPAVLRHDRDTPGSARSCRRENRRCPRMAYRPVRRCPSRVP